jgi:hypothetical protein
MTDEELERRGKQVFDKFSTADKDALKWFLTGQIQNILANEHGIGGKKDIASQVDRRVEARIASFASDDKLMQRLATLLAKDRRIDFAKLITDAARHEAQDAIKKAAGTAASRVKVHVFIEPDPNEPAETTAFGAF